MSFGEKGGWCSPGHLSAPQAINLGKNQYFDSGDASMRGKSVVKVT